MTTVVFKTETDGYYYDGATVTKITDVDYPATTVPGIVYLDDYYFVMTPAAEIFNSALGNPASWSALAFVSAEVEPDSGKGIAKWQNYLVAFGEWTSELFYDAGIAPPASPLSRVSNSVQQIGCVNGRSIAEVDGGLIWIGQSRSKGRSVYAVKDSFTPQRISTDDIDRILDLDDMATVYAWCGKIDGHRFYVLTLVDSAITLVCDIDQGLWYQWSTLTAQASKSVTALTQSNGIATATVTSHGYSDGDPVTIAGANQAGYNGLKNISYVDANTFTFEVDAATVTPATGTITSVGYTETYFVGNFYAAAGGKNLIMSGLDGAVYELDKTLLDDNGLPINVVIRTPKFDAENDQYKTLSRLEMIGDKVDSTAYVRWSDDDYVTNTKYRPVDLGAERSILRRCGNFRRRSFEIRHTEPTTFRQSSIEISIEQGT
jgi:hypothetical protein